MAKARALSRAEHKRNQIREGAQHLFLTQGFANTSTDAIASTTGVSKQTLYSYYPSKEKLLTDVLQQLVRQMPYSELTDDLQSPSDYTSLRQALNRLAEQFLGIVMQPDYVALIRVLVAESAHFPELGQLFTETIPAKAFRSVELILEEAKQHGVIVPVDMNAAARLFIGPLLTYAILDGLFTLSEVPQRPDHKQVEQIVDLYLRAVTA